MTATLNLGNWLKNGPLFLQQGDASAEEFQDFCRNNPEFRIERDAEGTIEVMALAGSDTGNRNSELARQLGNWNVAQGDPGYTFDSSAGFTLPNGAERSPDASWVSKERYEVLSDEERSGFAPLCPDFVVELMSPSDRLADVQAKMEEYRANGARLGWLIDRCPRQVYVYQPGRDRETQNDPTEVSAEPELPGFILLMNRIF